MIRCEPLADRIAFIDLVHDLAILKYMQVNVHYAKTHLSKILDRVSLGEEVVIAKAGKPVARLTRIEALGRDRVLGSGRGDFQVPEDFDDPLPEEVLREFYK